MLEKVLLETCHEFFLMSGFPRQVQTGNADMQLDSTIASWGAEPAAPQSTMDGPERLQNEKQGKEAEELLLDMDGAKVEVSDASESVSAEQRCLWTPWFEYRLLSIAENSSPSNFRQCSART